MNRLKKIKKIRLHREGTSILMLSLVGLLAVNALLFWGAAGAWPCYIVAGLCLVVYLLMVNFFRCPIRLFEEDTERTVVAPADGRIVVIEEVDEHEYFHDRRLMVSIFMSITNVHANWYPVDGTVKKVGHQNGRFMKAWLPKASTENERSMVVIETPEGHEVMRNASSTSTWASSSSARVWTYTCRWAPKCA
jgi:phosphatidylserine decarboxylase